MDPASMDLKGKYAEICKKYAKICINMQAYAKYAIMKFICTNMQKYALPTLLMMPTQPGLGGRGCAGPASLSGLWPGPRLRRDSD